jgi:hypothetical protein
MFQFKRGLMWILAGAVIGTNVLVYVGLFGTERHEPPPGVLDTRGTSAKDSASPAGPRPREAPLTAPREKKDRRASRGRLDPGVDTPVQQPVHLEEGSFLAADERLKAKDGTPMDAPALRKGTSSSETRIAEATKDRSQSDAGRVARGIFLRAVPRSTRRDAEPPDDWTGPETPWRSNHKRNQGWSNERDGARHENDDQQTHGVSDAALRGVSLGRPVMMTCADERWICNAFSLAFILPDTIPAVSRGIEAIQFPIAGGPDIVWIRTESGVIEVSTENLTDVEQLTALIDQLAAPR